MSKKIRLLRIKYLSIPVQVKASIWFLICSLLQKGLSIITIPIFTRLMTTEQYGYYTTYISWYNILLVFTSLNLFYGVYNNAMMKFKEDRAGYTSSMQGLIWMTTGIFFVLYLKWQNEVNLFLGMNTALVLMLFTELLLTPALQFWMASKRFEFKYRPIVIVTIIKTIANPVLGFILVLLCEQKDIARIVSVVIVEGALCLAITVYQFYKGKKFFSKEYWKYALLFNIPLLPHYLSGQILSQSDRIMISKMVGNAEVAIYSVAYNIGLLMNIFTSAINGSYTPWFYQNLEKGRHSQIQKVTTIIMYIMAALIILLMIWGPEAIAVLGSSEYRRGIYAVPPVAAGAFFMFLYNIFANIEFYYEKKGYVLFSSVAAALLNILLNFIFIPMYGYVAAAYTTLACYIVYSLLHNYFARYICREKTIPEIILCSKTVLNLSVLIVGTALMMNVLYKYTWIRYGLILIGLFALIVKRKKIVSVTGDMFSMVNTQKNMNK